MQCRRFAGKEPLCDVSSIHKLHEMSVRMESPGATQSVETYLVLENVTISIDIEVSSANA